jgi:hypothetical protein
MVGAHRHSASHRLRRCWLQPRSIPRARSAALERTHQLRCILIEIFTEIAAVNSGQSADTESTPAKHWTDLRPFVTDAMAHAELASEGSNSRDPRLEL